MSEAPLLAVKNLSKTFFLKKRSLTAVKNVSFDIRRGQTLGLVGESGCGKSTLGRLLLRLYEPTQGKIFFQGTDLTSLTLAEMKAFRKQIQMIFQDPYASLNPCMTAEELLEEPFAIHKLYTTAQKRERVNELLQQVGFTEAHKNRFPHEFSGGQRQRLGIARALALRPDFIVCDEPVSALDVSVQAQIVGLLQNLQLKFNLTYLFITHQLAIVRQIAHDIAVMYLGHFVEYAQADALFKEPLHPYTQMLLSAARLLGFQKTRSRILVQGELPNPFDPPTGCPFQTRCPHVMPICRQQMPPLVEKISGHKVACHLYD